MQIRLNGKIVEIEDSLSLTEFLKRYGVTQATGRVAVAFNEQITFRGDWDSQIVKAGDCIEIIQAVQGG